MGIVVSCTNFIGTTPWGIDSCQGPSSLEDGIADAGRIHLWPRSFLKALAAVPLISFALSASWAFLPIFGTLRDKTPARTGTLIVSSLSISFLHYSLISVYGYAMFCDAVTPNILEALGTYQAADSAQGYLVLVGKAMMAIQLTLATPMRLAVVRRTLMGEGQGCLHRCIVSGVLLGSATALACINLALNKVTGVVSSIGASLTVFILPAIIDLKLRLPGTTRKAVSAFALPFGIFVLVASTSANFM